MWQPIIRRLALTRDLGALTIGILQSFVPDLPALLEQEAAIVPELEGQAGKQRLISTVTNLFQEQMGWMLLILEDLHWSSDSLDILNQLNRLVEQLPLLIIGSYRNDERPSLPDILPHMQPLMLARLSAREMSQLSQAMLGQIGQQSDLLTLLQRETEGNAFFVVEVVRALAEEAGQLREIGQLVLPTTVFPKGIRTIVNRRLEQLSAQAKQLLTGAALAGRQVDPKMMGWLAEKMGLPL